jgi:hypothetical protein
LPSRVTPNSEAGRAAFHASLADEATLALKGKVAHALLVQAIEQNEDGLGWTSDPTQFAGVNATRGPSDKPYPEQDPDWSELWDATNFVAPSLPAVYAAVSQANGIKVPANIREMLQSPDFHGKGGWHEAVEREIAIVDKNIEVVSYAEYRHRKTRYGNLVSLGHAVVAIVQKQDAGGKRTKKCIRITFAVPETALTSSHSTPAVRKRRLARSQRRSGSTTTWSSPPTM